MKNTIIITMLLAFATVSFAQQATPNSNWKDSDLGKKSKTQKTVGWILAGAGTVGLFITLAEDGKQGIEGGMTEFFSAGYVQPEYKNYTGYYILSSAVIVSGVYLLFKGAKNKNKAKAATVFVDVEKAHVLQGTAFRDQMFPVVGLRIRL